MTTVSLFRANSEEEALAPLTAVAASLARDLQRVLPNRAQVTASFAPPGLTRFAEWRSNQNPFGMMVRYSLGAGDPEIALHVPGHFISQIIDIHYGGTGEISLRGTFTAAETKFTERLAENLQACLWAAVGFDKTGKSRPIEMQPDLLAFGWPKARDRIAILSIFIECPSLKATTISCLMDVSTAIKVAERLTSAKDGAPPSNPIWRAKMRSAATQVRLPAHVVLASTEISAPRLLTLAAGDIFPLLLPAKAPITVAGRNLAYGTIGEANGRAALKIEQTEGSNDE